jgi:hypothetical protein
VSEVRRFAVDSFSSLLLDAFSGTETANPKPSAELQVLPGDILFR